MFFISHRSGTSLMVLLKGSILLKLYIEEQICRWWDNVLAVLPFEAPFLPPRKNSHKAALCPLKSLKGARALGLNVRTTTAYIAMGIHRHRTPTTVTLSRR